MVDALPPDLPVAIGDVVADRYVVTGLLGRGGMGVVLAGRHRELDDRVAIKFLNREHAAHADRFFREARAAAKIRSPHVVRIFDVGRLPSGDPFMVMELLDGEDLGDRLRRSGPLELHEIADVLIQVCQALAEAHAAGIVHRDLKPANIFVARGPGGDDVVKLLDFGVAKVPDAGALTQTASMLGSPVYMSPEQLVAARDVDARSDIWSLGVVLYELLTGRLPFEGESLVHLAFVVREKETPRVRDVRPEVPEEIDAILARCLEKDRARRFADVGAFADALSPFVSGAVAHSIPRIRRVLSEGRIRAEGIASTVPPSASGSSPDLTVIPRPSRTPSVPTLPAAADATGPTLAATNAAHAATLAALSTSSPAASTSPSPPRASRTATVVAASAAAVAIAALLFAGRGVLGSGGEARGLASASRIEPPRALAPPSSIAPPDPAVSVADSAVAAGSQPAASASATPAEAPPRSPTEATARAPAKKAAAPAAFVKPAAASKAAANCNPPYTIDERGVRRAKPECL